ncbi:MAG: 4-(cytidine 5'-diphospho)-2-C-methyl-D-erythritol kinase [Desulfovibrionaceae bacterium]|nr:4-(cytidine 5'-diphospho)-2-C-methyl-D-erythritol kinase [Desulfovibrionaceae bacterium]
MAPITLRANCKVNLFLRITGVLPNGYHTLDSLFLPLPEPYDLLHIRPGAKPGLTLTCSAPAPDPRDNTLTRAYRLYAEASSFSPPLALALEKGIPAGAGLGGGSSDAAVLLRHLDNEAPKPLDTETLNAVAARVGADVPFFLQTCPCRARGIGDLLEPRLPGLAGLWLVLVCPDVQVSTPWAYAAWDALHPFAASYGLTKQDSEAREIDFRFHCLNDLEEAVFPAYPECARVKCELFRQGAAAAVMSGSGASQLGLFRDQRAARNAVAFFQAQGMRTYCHALSC